MKPLGQRTFAETYFETRTFTEGENVQKSSNTSLSKHLTLVKGQVNIPCLYIPSQGGSDKILLYFHGNAEDVGYSYDFCRRLAQGLKVISLNVS